MQAHIPVLGLEPFAGDMNPPRKGVALIVVLQDELVEVQAGRNPLCNEEVGLCPEAFQVAGLAKNML